MANERNTAYNALFIILVFLLTLTGCWSLTIPSKIIKTSNQSVIKKANSLFPIESFVMISQEFVMSTNICEPAGSENCKKQVIGTMSATGSGFIVDSKKEGTSYVVTAGHVCTPASPGFGIDPSTLDIGYRIGLKTGFGREAVSEIVAIDIENDI